jgi:hypothetical protein
MARARKTAKKPTKKEPINTTKSLRSMVRFEDLAKALVTPKQLAKKK